MTKQEREEYARSRVVLEEYGLTSSDLDRLHRYETALHRISERQCSEEMSEAETARVERREAAAEKAVQKIAEAHGLTVRFNGDPRGGAIRLVLPSGKSNNWDGETWGIFW